MADKSRELPVHPSLLHPLTGEPLRAIGVTKGGRAVWPQLGGAVNIVSRGDAAADVPAAVASLMIEGAMRQSAALTLFKQIPMNRRQNRIRIESALPMAYFVNGDTGVKQTTKMAWTDKLLTAEEIACIIPIPENVIDDADYDLWGAIMPDAQEAIGKALDEAIFFGVNKPSTYPDAIVTTATTMTPAHVYTRGTSTVAEGGIAEDLNQLAGIIEDDGFDVSGYLANRRIRRYLRGARSTQGEKLADFGPSSNSIDGIDVAFGARGSWPNSTTSGDHNALLVAGDFSQGILGVRKDITAKMLDQAVIQDPTDGSIVYNLAQQDMVALRLTCRFGFQVSNYVTWEQADDTKRYPFAVLQDEAVA